MLQRRTTAADFIGVAGFSRLLPLGLNTNANPTAHAPIAHHHGAPAATNAPATT